MSLATDPILEHAFAIALKKRKIEKPSLLEWTERYRYINGRPMVIPGPLRGIYECAAEKVVIMKGAQLGFSEWAINLMMWAADIGYAGRGNALYVQPTGGNAGDFVQGRVNPAIMASDYLESRIGQDKGAPDKVGLRKVGAGYTYWRTARSRSGLKSVPADVLILDEYDEMPTDTLALASHRLDSSTAPRTLLISTPTYPGSGIEPEYLAGDQRRYMLECPNCGTEQALEWEKNVDLDTMVRVCVECREDIEGVIASAWEDRSDRIGHWEPTNPDGKFPSFHLSQLYRPEADLAAIKETIESPDISKQQEGWNQHLGLPFSPPGNQLSLEELRRLILAPFSIAQIAGKRGAWMGIDVGARLHCVLTYDDVNLEYDTVPRRYLLNATEVSSFDEAGALMERYGVRCCVVDAHPEYHAGQAFQLQHPGRVWLADYQIGRMPPAFTDHTEPDVKRRWRIQVDRTAAIDAVFGTIRNGDIWFPTDAESIPGFFAMLMAPVRRLVPDRDGNPRGVYEEGARADHYAHAMVYAELAAHIGNAMPRTGVFDASRLSTLGSYERDRF